MILLNLILFAIYFISAACLLFKFIEKDINSSTSALFVICPIINTILIINIWNKENKIKEIKDEIKEVLNNLK